MEVIVAGVTFLLGALVVYDSLRLGTGWGDEGPKAGYFPFYIGLIICIGSVVNLVMGLRDKDSGSFVSKAQAADVLRVLIPMIVPTRPALNRPEGLCQGHNSHDNDI